MSVPQPIAAPAPAPAARPGVAVALVLLAGLAVKSGVAGLVELAEDEAYYWEWSRRLSAGYLDHPPAVAWVVRAGTALLGDTERGVRLGAAALSVLGLLPLWPHARDRWLFLALGLTTPLLALGGVLATPDAPLLFAWSLGLGAALAGRWGLAGLGAGLAILSKHTGFLLLPLLFLGVGRQLRPRDAARAAGVAALVAAPNIAWNLLNGLASYRFQWDHVREGGSAGAVAAAQLLLAGPLLFPVLLGAAVHGLRQPGPDRLLAVAGLVPLALGVLAGGEANWTAPAYPALLLLVARGPLGRRAWTALGPNAVLVALVLAHLTHPLVNLPWDPRDRLAGGRTLGEAVRAWGAPAVWTARYQDASLIAFYGGVEACPLRGHARPDQHDRWPCPDADTAVFVRPWRANPETAAAEAGWTVGTPGVVTAYVSTPEPTIPRPVARWQVFPLRRGGAPFPEGSE